MAITGNDNMSLAILAALQKGTRMKDIPLLYPVSLDQAKRLSRYHNILQAADQHLLEPDGESIRMLGLKVLALNALIKAEDWDGLREILGSVHAKTTRNELTVLIQALAEKRKRMTEFQAKSEMKLSVLEKREIELATLKSELQQQQQQLDEQTAFLSKYPVEIRQFLLKHLGMYEGKLVLARRLDSAWQKSLKKKRILAYEEETYIWHVNDLERLAEEYEKRSRPTKSFATEWVYEKEAKRNRQSKYPTPADAAYRLPNGLAQDLRSSMEAIEATIHELEGEREQLVKEMKQLRKTSPKSFMEAIEASNTLSVRDVKLHGELQEKALRWLYQRNFVVASEVLLPNGKRSDVIGYDEKGRTIIIEVKVSRADFQQDQKWISYLDYCHEFYFLASEEISPVYYEKEACKGMGLLVEVKNSLHLKEPFRGNQEARDQEKVQFAINKLLSRKFVFGY